MAARFDWESIRAEYEVGASQSDLSKRYGVSRTAIQKRIRAEGWVQDISGTVNRMAEAKVAGVVAGCNPQKKAEALDRAAEAKAAVITRHQREWDRHQAIMDEALSEGSFDKAKLAKITAETIKIRQEGERKAWGIVDKTALDHTSSDGSLSQRPVDLSRLSPDELLRLTKEAFKTPDYE